MAEHTIEYVITSPVHKPIGMLEPLLRFYKITDLRGEVPGTNERNGKTIVVTEGYEFMIALIYMAAKPKYKHFVTKMISLAYPDDGMKVIDKKRLEEHFLPLYSSGREEFSQGKGEIMQKVPTPIKDLITIYGKEKINQLLQGLKDLRIKSIGEITYSGLEKTVIDSGNLGENVIIVDWNLRTVFLPEAQLSRLKLGNFKRGYDIKRIKQKNERILDYKIEFNYKMMGLFGVSSSRISVDLMISLVKPELFGGKITLSSKKGLNLGVRNIVKTYLQQNGFCISMIGHK